MILDFDEPTQEPQQQPEATQEQTQANLSGQMLDMPQAEYRNVKAIANSGLLKIGRSPADYIHNLNAPRDPSKLGAADFGTALHQALLEPERADDYLIAPSATRTTKKFLDFAEDHPGRLLLLESEHDKLRFMIDSAYAHPTAAMFLQAGGHKEKSFFLDDEVNGVKFLRKWRPDIDLTESHNVIVDVKTTASLSDWRDQAPWRNPLSSFGYGHTAAYYLDSASKFYNRQINEYVFLVMQTTIELGIYPVAAFVITRDELKENGFYNKPDRNHFDDMRENLETYAERLKTGNWLSYERFNR